MTSITLQHQLIRRVHRLRDNRFSYLSLDVPQSVSFDEVPGVHGLQRRCRVVLTAHGCQVATCTMCPLPDEAVPSTTPVTTDNWLRQLKHALPDGVHADIFTLFHNGNFFSDREVSVQTREAVYTWLRETPVKTLVVESLPQFVTEDKLEQAWRHLRTDQRIEVAIGLQSTDAFLRETVLASTCSEQGFASALKALRSKGYGVQVFLMHQMPFLTVQEASVALVNSVQVLRSQHAVVDPILCPLRIAPATVAHELYQQGQLQLASMWELADVLAHIRAIVPGSRARVAVSLLQASTQDAPHTDACPQCRGALVNWISSFNCQQEGSQPPRCICAPQPIEFGTGYDATPVRARVQMYLTQKSRAEAPGQLPGTLVCRA